MSFDRVLISVASRTLLSLAILILLALGGMLSPQQTPSLGVLGQTCESFGGEPGECQAWVSNSSLVFFPVSQPASVAFAQAYLSQVTQLPNPCRDAAVALVCFNSFPICEITGAVHGTCRSVCENMLAQCTAIFTQLGAAALLPDCDAMINPVTPQYPEVAWLWPTVFNTTELVNCTSLPFSDTNSTNTTDSITCPPYYTLNYDPDTNPLLPCFPECPAPVFFYDQVDNLYFILISFALLNLVIGPIVLIPHLFTRNRWKWPQQINIWIMIVQLTEAFVFALPILAVGSDWQDLVCKDDNKTSADASDALCGFQSVVLIYVGWATALWWAFLIFKLILLVSRIRSNWLIEMILANLFCWLLPFLFLTIALSEDFIGAVPGIPYCFYQSTEFNWWVIVIHFIPTSMLLLFGACSLAYMIVMLLKIEGLIGLKHQFRLLLFITSYLVISGYVIINAYVVTLSSYDEIIIDTGNYLLCLLATYSTDACEDLHNDDHPNYPSVVIQVWLQAIRAGVYLLIFGIQSSVFYWWAYLFKYIFTCKWRRIPDLWYADFSGKKMKIKRRSAVEISPRSATHGSSSFSSGRTRESFSSSTSGVDSRTG